MMTQTGEAHRLPVLKERHLPGECRQSVTELLKETYGYDGFRNLEIYEICLKTGILSVSLRDNWLKM